MQDVTPLLTNWSYCKISNISRIKSHNLNDSSFVFAVVFAQSIEARC